MEVGWVRGMKGKADNRHMQATFYYYPQEVGMVFQKEKRVDWSSES